MSTLAVLAIFSLASLTFASSGGAAQPIWTDCRGTHPHGSVEVAGAVGQSTVVVSWTNPSSDWINAFPYGCKPYPFTQSIVDVYVVHPGINYVPSTVVCHSTSCSDGFTLLYQVCIGKYGCTNHIYDLVYGDTVVVQLTSTYDQYENHYGSFSLIIRD